jgi:hypothetical protein
LESQGAVLPVPAARFGVDQMNCRAKKIPPFNSIYTGKNLKFQLVTGNHARLDTVKQASSGAARL